MKEMVVEETEITTRHEMLQQWALAALRGDPVAERLRQQVLAQHDEFVSRLSPEPARAYRMCQPYAEEKRWSEIAPFFSKLFSILPQELTSAQREVVGVGAFILETSHAFSRLDTARLHIKPYEVASRRINAEEFGATEEDWIGSMSMVVWRRDVQEEAKRKDTSRKILSKALFNLVQPIVVEGSDGFFRIGPEYQPLTVQALETLYKGLILTVYPGAGTVPLLSDYSLNEMLLGLPRLNPELIPYLYMSRSDRRNGIFKILDRLNTFLPSKNRRNYPAHLAWTYAIVTGSHFLPDCNGTMARTFVDLLTRVYNTHSIVWSYIKSHPEEKKILDDAAHAWWFNRTGALEQWFTERIF